MPEMIEKYWAGQCLALDIADLEFEKAFTAYEYTRDINAKRAELKVMVEGGTEDDLLALYSEAAAETNEQKKGIFSTLIEKIIGVFRSIGQKITSFFSKKDIPDDKKNEKVNVPTEAEYTSLVGKFRAKISAAVSMIKNNALTENFVAEVEGLVAKLAAGAAVGFVAAKLTGNKGNNENPAEQQSDDPNRSRSNAAKKNVQATRAEAKARSEQLAKESSAIAQALENVKNFFTGGSGDDAQGNLFKRFFKAVSDGAKHIGSSASELMKAAISGITGKKDDENSDGNGSNEQPQQSNNPNRRRSNKAKAANSAAANNSDTTSESADDIIDVSTDEGMIAFEKMLDKLVADDDDIAAPVTESTEDVPPETEPAVATEDTQEADPEEAPAEEGTSDESGSDDGEITEESAMSDEESSALDDALAEFNSLFN